MRPQIIITSFWRDMLSLIGADIYDVEYLEGFMKDEYGSQVREENKEVMAEPFRPLNRRIDPLLKVLREERRSQWVRRMWWNFRDDVGIVLWLIVAVFVIVMAWLAFAGGLEWLRKVIA